MHRKNAGAASASALQTMVRDRNHNENPSFPDSALKTAKENSWEQNCKYERKAQEPLIENISPLEVTAGSLVC